LLPCIYFFEFFGVMPKFWNWSDTQFTYLLQKNYQLIHQKNYYIYPSKELSHQSQTCNVPSTITHIQVLSTISKKIKLVSTNNQIIFVVTNRYIIGEIILSPHKLPCDYYFPPWTNNFTLPLPWTTISLPNPHFVSQSR
jgi:hypothetical protein